MPSRRYPGKAFLALLVASALFSIAGLVQSSAFVAVGGQRSRFSLAAPGASVAPLQVVAGPEPPAASALRGLGCVLLVMGVFAARGSQSTSGSRLTGAKVPKVLVHLHTKALDPKFATSQRAHSVHTDCETSDSSDTDQLIDLTPLAPTAATAAFGQTAQRLVRSTARSSKAKAKATRAKVHAKRREHRHVGAKLCASLRYEMPPLSFDSSQVRAQIQMGLSIGASPKIPKSRNAARSNESIESDQTMADLLFRSCYNSEDHEKEKVIPVEDQWSPTSLVQGMRTCQEAL